MDTIVERPREETGEGVVIPEENYKSRLAVYLAGFPLEKMDLLMPKVMKDKERFHKELKFPPIELLVNNPIQYKKELTKLAADNGIKIISVADVPDWVLKSEPAIQHVRDQPSPMSGCYSEELDSVVSGDLYSIDPNVLGVLAHEIAHAIDFKNMKQGKVQPMTIEQLEYRAYLLSGFSQQKMSSNDAPMYIRGLFGDAQIVGSSLGFYLDKARRDGICLDTSDFFKKASEGKLQIPWYGSRKVM